MALIGYARVSTCDQNPALQIDALTRAGCERIFVETGSGAKRDRPKLDAALALAAPRDTFVVWKLDRLARSLRQLIDTMETLEARGVGFLSLTESIDTTTAGGRLVFHMFGALAEFERSIIRERTLAGLAAARARGRRGGRRPKLGDDLLSRIAGMPEFRGLAVPQMAFEVGVSKSTLYRQLRRARSNDGGESVG